MSKLRFVRLDVHAVAVAQAGGEGWSLEHPPISRQNTRLTLFCSSTANS